MTDFVNMLRVIFAVLLSLLLTASASEKKELTDQELINEIIRLTIEHHERVYRETCEEFVQAKSQPTPVQEYSRTEVLFGWSAIGLVVLVYIICEIREERQVALQAEEIIFPRDADGPDADFDDAGDNYDERYYTRFAG